MMVMPSNMSIPWVHYWAGRAPGSMGHLYSPGGERGPYPWLPYALDNGAFTGFDEGRWKALLNWACLCGTAPLWVAMPDAVGDPELTSRRWEQYHDELARFHWPMAFVVQDGHTEADVPKDAAVVFVGGSTEWKHKTIEYWAERFPRVHVGRISSAPLLRRCADAGVESIDSTSFRNGKANEGSVRGLMRFLNEEYPHAMEAVA